MGKKAEKALPDILEIAANGETSLQRETAVEALGNIGVARPDVVRAVRAALKDSRGTTTIAAVKGLWQLSAMSEEDLRLLVGVVEDPEMTSLTRADAMEVLGKIGPKAKAAVPALLKALQDRDDFVREVAAEQLKQIDPKAAKKAGIRPD
jgi:hypothetical protein